ncbi:MAG TPA: hypothetical protein VGT02_18375 [Methylomirabilota bacterium]|nr:hypothetical protein [Methylomirabilota bacterium]
MTYGFVPSNWYAFARELEARGIAPGDIEKIEMRPASGTTFDVVLTARSGEVHTWRHEASRPSTP